TAAAAVTAVMRGVTVLRHGAASAEALRQVLACLAETAADSGVGLAVACPTAQSAVYVNAVLGDALRAGPPAGGPEPAAEEEDGAAPEAAEEEPSSEEGPSAEEPAPEGGPGDPVAEAAADLAALGEPAPAAAAQNGGVQDGGAQDGPAAAAPAVACAAVPLGRLREAGVPVPAGIVAVTDAMALDVERAAALVEACEDGTHLVLFADPAEAPSARPGQVVPDLLRSRLAAVAELPAAPSAGPLETLAAAVAGGDLPQVDAPGREVVVVPAGSGSEAAHRAVQLLGDSIPRALGIPAEHVQIVAATRGGDAGTDALNRACKERFNPGPGALRGLDPGDRVLLGGDGPGYSAGDIGYLRAPAEDGGDRPRVELPGGAAVPVDPAHLRPGWAVTVAAAHGSRWPAAVAVFGPETRGSRPQVYTALTRATRHLSIVHAAGPDLARAVADRASRTRTPRLVAVTRAGCPARSGRWDGAPLPSGRAPGSIPLWAGPGTGPPCSARSGRAWTGRRGRRRRPTAQAGRPASAASPSAGPNGPRPPQASGRARPRRTESPAGRPKTLISALRPDGGATGPPPPGQRAR